MVAAAAGTVGVTDPARGRVVGFGADGVDKEGCLGAATWLYAADPGGVRATAPNEGVAMPVAAAAPPPPPLPLLSPTPSSGSAVPGRNALRPVGVGGSPPTGVPTPTGNTVSSMPPMDNVRRAVRSTARRIADNTPLPPAEDAVGTAAGAAAAGMMTFTS